MIFPHKVKINGVHYAAGVEIPAVIICAVEEPPKVEPEIKPLAKPTAKPVEKRKYTRKSK